MFSWKPAAAAGALLAAAVGFYTNSPVRSSQERSVAQDVVLEISPEEAIAIKTKDHLERSHDQNLDALFGFDHVLENAVEEEKAHWLGNEGLFPVIEARRKAKQEGKRRALEEIIERLTIYDHYFNIAEDILVGQGRPANRFVHYGLITQESMGFINAYHPESRVKGICQFKDSTAQSMGVIVSNTIIDSYDPQAIEACLLYLEDEVFRDLSSVSDYEFDYRHQLAGYNGGPFQIKFALRKGKEAYAELKSFYGSKRTLPLYRPDLKAIIDVTFNPQQETADYIVGVAAFADIFRYASLPIAKKDDLRKKLLRELDQAKGTKKLEIENNLLALDIEWHMSPQWSVHVADEKNCHYLEKGDSFEDFDEHTRAFNARINAPTLEAVRRAYPRFCYRNPEVTDETKYIAGLVLKK